jgi:hypothetical protein
VSRVMANRSRLGIEADTFPMPQGSPRFATISSSTVVEKGFSHMTLDQRGRPKVFGCAGGHVSGLWSAFRRRQGRWVIVYRSMIGRPLASEVA